MPEPTLATASGATAPSAPAPQAGAGVAVVFRIDGEPMAVRADRSTRVSGAQPLSPMPLLPQQCLGVAAFDGRVVPVLDLADLLDRPPVSATRHDLIHTEVDGSPYAFAVDRVLQVASGCEGDHARWQGMAVPLVDLAMLVGQALGPLRPVRHPPSVAAKLPESPRAGAASRAIAAAGDGLIVGTAGGNVRLPMSLVVEMHDEMTFVPVPDERPGLCGAALYRGRLVPRVSLDALLHADARHSTARQPGAWVVVDAAGHRVAIGVRRVIGTSSGAHDPMIDLEPLLAQLLGDGYAGRVAQGPAPAPEAPAASGRKFLLVEVGGRKCALPLAATRHLHVDCWVSRAPAATGQLQVFVASVGDRVVPVIPLARLLGLRRQAEAPQWIELSVEGGWHMLVAVDRAIGMVRIEDSTRIRPPQGTAIDALARHGEDTVWLLDPVQIARRSGWDPDEA